MGIEKAKELLVGEIASLDSEIAPLVRQKKVCKNVLIALNSLDRTVEPAEKEVEPANVPEPEKLCSHCNKPNPIGAARCIHCGASMKKRR